LEIDYCFGCDHISMSNSQFDSVASVILGHFSFAVSIHARASCDLDKASLSALESLVKLATPTCIWRLLGPATMPLDFVVPDNLKTGVTKPNYYDPDTNPTCDMAQH
jgi:hypothetical protein